MQHRALRTACSEACSVNPKVGCWGIKSSTFLGQKVLGNTGTHSPAERVASPLRAIHCVQKQWRRSPEAVAVLEQLSVRPFWTTKTPRRTLRVKLKVSDGLPPGFNPTPLIRHQFEPAPGVHVYLARSPAEGVLGCLRHFPGIDARASCSCSSRIRARRLSISRHHRRGR